MVKNMDIMSFRALTLIKQHMTLTFNHSKPLPFHSAPQKNIRDTKIFKSIYQSPIYGENTLYYN